MLINIGIDRDSFSSHLIQTLRLWKTKNVYMAVINTLEDSIKEFLVESNGLGDCLKKNSIIDVEFGFNKTIYENKEDYPCDCGLGYFLDGLELSIVIKFKLYNSCFDELTINDSNLHGFWARPTPFEDLYYMLSDYGFGDKPIIYYEAQKFIDSQFPNQWSDNWGDVLDYGYFINYPCFMPFERVKMEKKRLKTQTNIMVNIPRAFLDGRLFKEAYQLLTKELSDKLISDTTTGYYRDIISFNNALTNEKFFCECSRDHHEHIIKIYKEDLAELKKKNSESNLPFDADQHERRIISKYQNVVYLLELTPYKSDICHLCISRKEGVDSIISTYGILPKRLDSYYDGQHQFSSKIGFNEANEEVKSILGINKWKTEAEVYFIVKELFREYQVTRESTPGWLGRQRLDIYIDELKLAFEYQGRQHYEPVDFFGGDEALVRSQERDRRKLALCKKNGVEIIYIRYDETVSKSLVKRKALRYL